jgi:hypothetical protein
VTISLWRRLLLRRATWHADVEDTGRNLPLSPAMPWPCKARRGGAIGENPLKALSWGWKRISVWSLKPEAWSRSQSYVTTDGQSASLSWCQIQDFCCCQIDGVFGCCRAPFLTRGHVCRLQLLLGFASAVILGSESRGTHGHIFCLIFETSPTWRARPPYLYPSGTVWPSYILRYWAPFSSPPATFRAEMEVF